MGSSTPEELELRPLGFTGYHRLMRYRVVDVLLVASPYDCFILEEDGQFSDRIFSEYLELHLSDSPRFSQVTTGADALAHLRRRDTRVDMVLMTPHCADMPPRKLAATIKQRYPQLPVVMLTYDRVSAQTFAAQADGPFDHVFLWSGDPRLLMAMVKCVEDLRNASRDTRVGDVRVIVVVEDSPSFYSSYLPILYTEVLKQTRSLMSDVLHEAERLYRMRARPKVLLARTYEQGRDLLRRYRDNLLGLVVDRRFPRNGVHDPNAGARLIKLVRKRVPDLPILLQSADPAAAEDARRLGVNFADKKSPELLARLRAFMWEHLGFGPFIFRLPNGREVDRADDLEDLLECLKRVPDASIRYHGERNHFSNWLMARSQFALAQEVRPWRMSDFPSADAVRKQLIRAISDYLENRQKGQVTAFRRGNDPLSLDFTRVGGGSLGGKARGLAFVSARLARHPIHERFPDVRIFVPRTTVICTDVFERFVATNGLRERALEAESDAEVARLFLEQPLDDEIMEDLSAIMAEVRYPVAIRSSSLLEDSAFQPFAGLYRTIMLPNASRSERDRLEQFTRAVRLVMASTFFQAPRTFMAATGIRLEEQAMAVVVQKLVGNRHGDRFYPDFAGVAQSHNFYPIRYMTTEDGIANVALGLGQQVVEGGKALRFSPRHPQILPQMSTVPDALRNTQTHFYALDLTAGAAPVEPDEMHAIRRFGLEVAETDGTLAHVGATYDPRNDRIYDTIDHPGVRIVNFAPVLKYDRYPLAPLLEALLEFGREGMGTAAEMEFACRVRGDDGRPEMAVLQLRPLVAESELAEVEATLSPEETLLLRGDALGNGVIIDIRDVVYVHPDRFDRARTRAIAQVVRAMNGRLVEEKRPYLLIGPGRWGTADPWLGVPVNWASVSGARVIVELSVPDLAVDPSQGTHFFHNLTSLKVGYFTVSDPNPEHAWNLDPLEALPAVAEAEGVRHVRLPHPVEVRIDGRIGKGVAVLRRPDGH